MLFLRRILLVAILLLPVQRAQGADWVMFISSIIKLACGLAADSRDVSDMKDGSVAIGFKYFERLGHLSSRMGLAEYSIPDYSRKELIAFPTLLFQVIAVFPKLFKDIEESFVRVDLKKEYGDTLPDDVVKEFYAGTDSKWSGRFKFFIRFVDFSLSTSLFLTTAGIDDMSLPVFRDFRRCLKICRSICELLLRYVCNKNEYKSKTIIGKMESAGVLFSCGCEILDKGYAIYEHKQELKELRLEEEKRKKRSKQLELCDESITKLVGLLEMEKKREEASWVEEKMKEFHDKELKYDKDDGCTICYDAKGKNREFFKCGHHVCEDCISGQSILNVVSNNSGGEVVGEAFLRCPFCREKSFLEDTYSINGFGDKVFLYPWLRDNMLEKLKD